MYEPELEHNLPIQLGDSKEGPTLRQRAAAALKTAGFLASQGLTYPPVDKEAVKNAINTIASGKTVDTYTTNKVLSNPENALHIHNILTEYDMRVVEDAVRIRNYVTNRLIVESTNNDPKIRMRALQMLGNITDVGLFTEKTEVTIKDRSTEDLENLLRERIKRLSGNQTIEDATPIMPRTISVMEAFNMDTGNPQ
jgi:hypothetical protein